MDTHAGVHGRQQQDAGAAPLQTMQDGMDRLGGLSEPPRHRILTGRIRARTRDRQMAQERGHGREHGHACGRSRAATTGCRSRTRPVSAGTDADAYLASVPRPSARHGSGIPVALFPVNARDCTCAGRSADCRDSATGCDRDTEHAPEATDCTSLKRATNRHPVQGHASAAPASFPVAAAASAHRHGSRPSLRRWRRLSEGDGQGPVEEVHSCIS